MPTAKYCARVSPANPQVGDIQLSMKPRDRSDSRRLGLHGLDLALHVVEFCETPCEFVKSGCHTLHFLLCLRGHLTGNQTVATPHGFFQLFLQATQITPQDVAGLPALFPLRLKLIGNAFVLFLPSKALAGKLLVAASKRMLCFTCPVCSQRAVLVEVSLQLLFTRDGLGDT